MRSLHLTSPAHRKAALQSAKDLEKMAGHGGNTTGQGTNRNTEGESEERQRGLGAGAGAQHRGSGAGPCCGSRSPGIQHSCGIQHSL